MLVEHPPRELGSATACNPEGASSSELVPDPQVVAEDPVMTDDSEALDPVYRQRGKEL